MGRHWPGEATVVEFEPREFSCFEAFRRVLYAGTGLAMMCLVSLDSSW
jgi:hypothetical protein